MLGVSWTCSKCSQLNSAGTLYCANPQCRGCHPQACGVDLGVVAGCVQALLPRLRHTLKQPTVEAEVVGCYCLPQHHDERIVAVTNLVVRDEASCRQADIQFRRTETGQAILLRVDFRGTVTPTSPSPAGQAADLPQGNKNCVAVDSSSEGEADHPEADRPVQCGAATLAERMDAEGTSLLDADPSQSGHPKAAADSENALSSHRAAQGCAYWLAQMVNQTATPASTVVPMPAPGKAEEQVPLQEVQYRVLSRLEKLFWTYYDDVCKGDADAPRGRLTTEFRRFASRVLAAVPSLLPPCQTSLAEVLCAFERTKSSAPRAYLVMLNPTGTQVVMVRQVRNAWWFLPGGKQEPQETLRITALREAYEETGFDATPHLVDVEVQMKGVHRPTHVWFATKVPEEFAFQPQTVGEVADVAWRLLDSHAANQAAADHWLARLLGWIHALQGHAQCTRSARRRLMLETPDLICRFDARQAEKDPFVGALCRCRALRRPSQEIPAARTQSPVHCLAVSNVPPLADWRGLHDVMAPFGALHTVHLSHDVEENAHSQPALVAFHERAAGEAAIAALDGRFVMEGGTCPMKVAWWPRSLRSDGAAIAQDGDALSSAPPATHLTPDTDGRHGGGIVATPGTPSTSGGVIGECTLPLQRKRSTQAREEPQRRAFSLHLRQGSAFWRSQVFREYMADVAKRRSKKRKTA
eukprot:GGOE01019775.1.p1 GENE.GGOE01019775.1~~GGOE01019775.1.p1  ORF type:complete len:696 (-),score=86.93 GGOE01019775.1:142-2229(-)